MEFPFIFYTEYTMYSALVGKIAYLLYQPRISCNEFAYS